MFRESHSIILFIFYQKTVESMALLIKLFSIHESLKERTMKNFLILSLLLYIKKKQKKQNFEMPLILAPNALTYDINAIGQEKNF